ncbi:hypothetical protein SCALM49S_00764 [Streptomyces californicus]
MPWISLPPTVARNSRTADGASAPSALVCEEPVNSPT